LKVFNLDRTFADAPGRGRRQRGPCGARRPSSADGARRRLSFLMADPILSPGAMTAGPHNGVASPRVIRLTPDQQDQGSVA
jgi:hypothetical protein